MSSSDQYTTWYYSTFIGVFIGILTYNLPHFVLKFIPYSVCLLIIGSIVGAIDKFSELNNVIGSVDPHLFLQIVLPNLIFFSVFNINYYTMKKVLWQAFVLAIPGVLLNSFLTALIVKFFIPNLNWDWSYSILLGAILSATDPVAVITLLLNINAPQYTSTIIEAESLYNDASAIVIFDILLKLIESNASQVAISYTQHAKKTVILLCGPFIGLFPGLLLVFCVSKLPHATLESEITETSLTLVFSNLVYGLAEYLESSGVLASVTLGLVCARFKSHFSPKNIKNLLHFWELIEFIVKTLIFLISGIIVTHKGKIAMHFNPVDIGYVSAIYLWIHVTRFITLGVMYPILRFLDKNWDWKVMLVLWFGSLRGVIGLSLALITNLSKNFKNEISDLIIFFVCSIVFLTLLINGTTIRFFLKCLKIKGSLYQSNYVITTALDHLDAQSNYLLTVLAQNNHFSGANWMKIKTYLPDYSKLLKVKEYEISSGFKYCISNIRYRFICSMKNFYAKQHYDGMITNHAYNILINAAEEAIDRDDLSVQWNNIRKHFKMPIYLKLLNKVSFLNKLVMKIIMERIFLAVQLSTSFILASDRNEIIVNNFSEWKESEQLQLVEMELQNIEKSALLELQNIQKTYPEIYQAIQTRNAKVYILNNDIHNIRRMEKDGIIQSSECHEMIEKIEAIIQNSEISKLFDYNTDPMAGFRNLPFISPMSQEEIFQLCSKVRHKVYSEDHLLFNKGQFKNCAYLIIRGLVRLSKGENDSIIYGTGSILNLWSTFANSASISTCQCTTTVTALKIKSSVLDEIAKNKECEEKMLKYTGFMLLQLLFIEKTDLGNDAIKLGKIVLSSSLKRMNGKVSISCNALLLKGRAKSIAESYSAPAIISLQSDLLNEAEGITVNKMDVEFDEATLLLLDGKGSAFSPKDLNMLGNAQTQEIPIERRESLGHIYIKGSNASYRTQMPPIFKSSI